MHASDVWIDKLAMFISQRCALCCWSAVFQRFRHRRRLPPVHKLPSGGDHWHEQRRDLAAIFYTGPITLIILFLVLHFNFLFVPCGRLSWLPISFLLHVKYTLSYRIVSYRLVLWYQTCEHNILMQIGRPTSGPRGKGTKRSSLGSGGQRSRSHGAEICHKNTFRWDISRTVHRI